MTSVANMTVPWIRSPRSDLFFFSFGWVLIFSAYWVFDQTAFKGQVRWVLLHLVLLVTVFHRHLTFPLVYGDPDQFRSRKISYILLPVLFLLITVGSLFYVKIPTYVTNTLPTPMSFSSSEGFKVLEGEGKQSKNFPVNFQGTEKSVEDVARTINRDLKGHVNAVAREGRLEFSLINPKGDSRFSFQSFKGKNLQPRLGMKNVNRGWYRASLPLFLALLVISALWNMYHSLMQKMGILRIYSRKAGYGKAWLDKAMVFVWFGFLFFQLAASSQVTRQAQRLAHAGRVMTEALEPFQKFIQPTATTFLIVALCLTALYLVEEFKNRERFHLPKNLFMVSILLIYATFFYDFLVGFVVFGFSHAVEYLAFVNIFSRRKFLQRPEKSSLMARVVRHQGLVFGVFILVSSIVFIPWFFIDRTMLNWYIVGTSFLHFIYDGWIWKVRDPKVGKPLGIEYTQPPQLQPA